MSFFSNSLTQNKKLEEHKQKSNEYHIEIKKKFSKIFHFLTELDIPDNSINKINPFLKTNKSKHLNEDKIIAKSKHSNFNKFCRISKLYDFSILKRKKIFDDLQQYNDIFSYNVNNSLIKENKDKVHSEIEAKEQKFLELNNECLLVHKNIINMQNNIKELNSKINNANNDILISERTLNELNKNINQYRNINNLKNKNK